jgi:hypothetical protein
MRLAGSYAVVGLAFDLNLGYIMVDQNRRTHEAQHFRQTHQLS